MGSTRLYKRYTKTLSMKTALPMNMPQSVKDALARIWTKLPPNMREICYTYGDICFTPRDLPLDVEKHEEVHQRQQGDKPDEWWSLYGRSPQFRYEQELEAYRVQYQFFLARNGKRKAFEFAKRLARDMSAEMYGGMCSYERALFDLIKK